MRFVTASICVILLSATANSALAEPAATTACANPDALGTSRTLVIDPAQHVRLGTMQYPETLPLADKEVVLTFDDGPLSPYSKRVLDALAAECVKATFFMVGNMAKAYPQIVQRVYAEGHTIGTHSQSHPFNLDHRPLAFFEQEVQGGIALTAAALGNPAELSPFFRIPGLARSNAEEKYLASQGLMTWSADFPADDWTHISANEVKHRALARLEAKGKGILLLHDIQPATALALPSLLRELKARGFRVVHVVAAGPGRPATPTTPDQWFMHRHHDAPPAVADAGETWPSAPVPLMVASSPVLPAPNPFNFGFDREFSAEAIFAGSMLAKRQRLRIKRGQVPLPPVPIWPRQQVPTGADGGNFTMPVLGIDAIGMPGAERAIRAEIDQPRLQAPVQVTAAAPTDLPPAVAAAERERPRQWPVPEVPPQVRIAH